MTAYDGVPRTYDEVGNLLTDGTWTYTWQNGRELASMTDGTTTWTYTYDANGMRTQRSNGTKTYNYVYNGSQLTQMTVGNDTLYFTYGILGPTTVTWNGTTYYYALNAQGDVIGIYDEDGNLVVVYNWDNAWGYNPIPEGSMASTLGVLNPLRYRGYVYDTETGYYYLQSRYYDPEIGRFINADVFTSTGQGFIGNNMFAYCGNNPVCYVDPSGNAFFTALGALTGFVAGTLTAIINNAFSEEKIDVFTAGVQGAIGGAISGAGVDIALLLIGSFGTALPVVALAAGTAYMAGGIGNAYTTYASSNGAASDEEMTMSFHIGGAFNLLSLGTSLGSAASSVDELMFVGAEGLKVNLAVGTAIAVSTSIATGIGSRIFLSCRD